MAKKIIITGGGGFVAGSMLKQAPEDCELHAFTRGSALAELPRVVWHTVDPMDTGATGYRVDEIAPDAIVHTAAIAGIDYCEANHLDADEANARMTHSFGAHAARNDAKFVYCSTDNVFDGSKKLYTEDDPPAPVNYYGETKVAGEKITEKLTVPWVVARVSIVMGLPMLGVGNSFLSRMIPQLEAGEELGVPPTEIRTPIDVVTLGQALLELATNDFTGYLHLSGDDVMNRCEMVQRIAAALGFDSNLVVPNDPTDIPGRANRPIHAALSNARAHRVLKQTELCGLEEGIARVMAHRD